MAKQMSLLERLRPERWDDLAQGLDHSTVKCPEGSGMARCPPLFSSAGRAGPERPARPVCSHNPSPAARQAIRSCTLADMGRRTR